MTKATSLTIFFDDDWEMIQVRHMPNGHWTFYVRINNEWYYGIGDTIATAQSNCETKILESKGWKDAQKRLRENKQAESSARIEDIF